MAARILTALLLVLAFVGDAAAQPAPPDVEFNGAAMDSARAAVARMAAGRPPPPPPIAERSREQLPRGDLAGVLTGVAAYLRDVHYAGRDSIVVADRFDATFGGIYHNPNHEYIIPSAEELALLRRELGAETASPESVIGPCRGGGCELKAPRVVVLGQPLLRTDGTVTMVVETRSRALGRSGPPSWLSIIELVLTRNGDVWVVTAFHGRFVS